MHAMSIRHCNQTRHCEVWGPEEEYEGYGGSSSMNEHDVACELLIGVCY